MRANETTVPSDVLEVLKNGTVTPDSFMMVGQLERKLYERANEVLNRLGGKWNKKEKAHLFIEADDVRGLIAETIATGQMPRRNPDAFFVTPPGLTARIALLAATGTDESMMWLEPSCGTGALVKATKPFGIDQGQFTCVEINESRARETQALGFAVHCADFLKWQTTCGSRFNRIIMNPPFSVEGNRIADVAHIAAAWELLAPNGLLIAIASQGVKFRTDMQTAALRELINAHGNLEVLPDDSFKESGTGVSTVLITMRKATNLNGVLEMATKTKKKGGSQMVDNVLDVVVGDPAKTAQFAGEDGFKAVPESPTVPFYGDPKPFAEALLGKANDAPQIVMLDPNEVKASPWQPRTLMDEPEMEELTASVRESGVRQPVTVRLVEDENHEDVHQLVFGHRRCEAARRAGVLLPCIVRAMSDQQAAEEALIENLQRVDLNPIDEARGYKRLLDEFKMTQEQLAERVHRSQSVIANALRLLQLPADVQAQIGHGLTPSHGLALCVLDDETHILNYALRAVEGAWSVKSLEAEIAAFRQEEAEKKQPLLPEEDEPDNEEQVPMLEPESQSESTVQVPNQVPNTATADEIPQCRVCGKSEAEVEAGGAHMTKFNLCSACDPEAQSAPDYATDDKAFEEVVGVKFKPTERAKKPKADEFKEGDGVQWSDGSKPRTGIIFEVGKALYFVQPTGTNEAKHRKTFQKKNCILKPWDKKSTPDTSPKTAGNSESSNEASKPAKPTSVPSAAPPAPPAGFIRALVPQDDYFFCEDKGLSIAPAFAMLRRVIGLAERMGLDATSFVDHLQDVMDVAAENTTPEGMKQGIFLFEGTPPREEITHDNQTNAAPPEMAAQCAESKSEESAMVPPEAAESGAETPQSPTPAPEPETTN